jgi:hypothetical protein
MSDVTCVDGMRVCQGDQTQWAISIRFWPYRIDWFDVFAVICGIVCSGIYSWYIGDWLKGMSIGMLEFIMGWMVMEWFILGPDDYSISRTQAPKKQLEHREPVSAPPVSGKLTTCGLLAAAAALFAGQANASSITISNFSFESPVTGSFAPGCPTSWNCTASVGGFGGGVYVPVSTQFMPGSDGLSGGRIVPDGSQVAYVTGGLPQVLAQNTSESIAADTTYTLNVYAGARNDSANPWTASPPFQPTIELLANGSVVASLILTDPGQGKWGNYTLSWDSSLAPSDVGQTLGLALVLPARSTGDTTNLQVASRSPRTRSLFPAPSQVLDCPA